MTVVSGSSRKSFRKRNAMLPGFRFHPTDEELVLYYLKKKIRGKKLRQNIIAETDVYKWNPEELPGQSVLQTGDRQWFFFSPRDRKYPNGARSNRATRQGYWKATGKDRNVTYHSRTVGVKKTLVFYKGRAPNGERTDWVMHEYTLDEEELKRCEGVEEYFALYKLFKKSGPGPKNGEQYGAPFKEEEWEDDDFVELNDTLVDDEEALTLTQQPHEVFTSIDSITVNEVQPSIDDDTLELIRRILDDEPIHDQLQETGCLPALAQAFAGASQTAMVDQFFAEPTATFHPSTEQFYLQPISDITQSAISHVHVSEAPEVTSAPKDQEELPLLHEGDFLEINDLLEPELTFSNVDKPLDNLQFEDGSSEFDLFHDASMFIQDIGPIDQENVPLPDMNVLGGNQDYQLLPYPEDATQTGGEFWIHAQGNDILALPEQSDVTFSLPTPGVVCDSAIVTAGGNQNQNRSAEDVATSSFSSALWSFVDSIPTTPASACEAVLANRAFERVSSFRRMKFNAKNTSVAAGNNTGTKKTAGRTGAFFLFLSVIVALCAFLWASMGTLKPLGRWNSW
ncbi:hypothetical protein L6164_007453 [Bauhinia variegata]|uniref:Uncharacterized protein n=1 Tax=Bauhinia variegata TaxID=167791 RepID=A0ACB9PD56_BAUVA|nr:hypothetical protein L6164_007453 [Bauhinia variegata]